MFGNNLDEYSLPQDLKITATADDGTIMAVRHKEYFSPFFIID